MRLRVGCRIHQQSTTVFAVLLEFANCNLLGLENLLKHYISLLGESWMNMTVCNRSRSRCLGVWEMEWRGAGGGGWPPGYHATLRRGASQVALPHQLVRRGGKKIPSGVERKRGKNEGERNYSSYKISKSSIIREKRENGVCRFPKIATIFWKPAQIMPRNISRGH